MTWLQGLPAGTSDWERLSAVSPPFFRAWHTLEATAFEVVDPIALELCRLRVGMLLGLAPTQQPRNAMARAAGVADDQVVELSNWPRSALFSERQRDCLAFAEQFTLDVTGVGQEMVDRLLTHFAPSECYAFVYALWSFEAMLRVCLVLGVAPTPETVGS